MKKLVLCGVIFPAIVNLFALDGVLINQNNILNDRVTNQINSVSKEIYEKTGVFLGVSVGNDDNFKNTFDKSKELVNGLERYSVIVLDIKSQRINILNSKNIEKAISKDKLLSFYYLKWGFFPTQGAILPLISLPKTKDPYNAGVLNGFNEMAVEISEHFNITLDYQLENTNQNFLNGIRLIFYVVVFTALVVIVRRKIKKKQKMEK